MPRSRINVPKGGFTLKTKRRSAREIERAGTMVKAPFYHLYPDFVLKIGGRLKLATEVKGGLLTPGEVLDVQSDLAKDLKIRTPLDRLSQEELSERREAMESVLGELKAKIERFRGFLTRREIERFIDEIENENQ